MILTCTGEGHAQRWHVVNEDGGVAEATFLIGQGRGRQHQMGPYQFTLISSTLNHFQSTLTTIATIAMNNTVVECNDDLPPDTVMIRIAGLSMYIAIMLQKDCRFIHILQIIPLHPKSSRVRL